MSEPMDNVPNIESFRADMIELATRLIPIIGDDYRVEYQEDETPTMQVTVGCECSSPDAMSWSYQTGDNSFTGGAYGYEYWGIAYLQRDTKPEDFAKEVMRSLLENDSFNFEEEAS